MGGIKHRSHGVGLSPFKDKVGDLRESRKKDEEKKIQVEPPSTENEEILLSIMPNNRHKHPELFCLSLLNPRIDKLSNMQARSKYKNII